MELPIDVLAYIERSFPPEQQEQALSVLGQANIEDGTTPNPRLLRCAALASRGNLSQLQRLVSLLAVDWRDVIMAGEYELRDKIPVRVRDLSTPNNPSSFALTDLPSMFVQ